MIEQVEQLPSAESSDSDELPDLSFDEVSSDWIDKLSVGDIVWAKFRRLYWPALVRSIYKKDKKVSIWYLDTPKKTFKIPFNKIKSFCDSSINEEIRNELEKSPLKALHNTVWLNAITYIRRQSEGQNDDPAEFFDLQKHYLAYKNLESKGIMPHPSAMLNTASAKYQIPSTTASSDEESLYSGSEEENVINKKLSILYDLDDSNEMDPRAEMILECIVTGNTNKHLLSIRAKKQSSKYYEFFEKAMLTDREKLIEVTAPDVIKNTNKLREIAVYLLNLYEKHVEGGKRDMVDYVMYVWLPEAINKAVEMVDNDLFKPTANIPRRKLFPTDRLLVPVKHDLTTLIKKESSSNEKSSKKKIDEQYLNSSEDNRSDQGDLRRSSRKKSKVLYK